MAFTHGKGTRVMVAGYDLSAYLNTADDEATQGSHDVTTYTKNTVQRAAGLRDGKVTLGGLYDSVHDNIVSAYLASANGEAFTLCPGGDVAGGQARLGTIRHVSYKTSQPVGGMVAMSASVECAAVWEPNGKVLHTLHQETGTGNEASVLDVAAATTNGGAASIHCTAASGTLDVKIQHSTNDSTWADLSPAFTQLTAIGSQIIEIAAGTTVNKYLREYHTVSGTFTYLVTFARR